jgi:hypothetical protein
LVNSSPEALVPGTDNDADDGTEEGLGASLGSACHRPSGMAFTKNSKNLSEKL